MSKEVCRIAGVLSLLIVVAGCASPPKRILDRIQMHEGEWIVNGDIVSTDCCRNSTVILEKGPIIIRAPNESEAVLVSRNLGINKMKVCGRQTYGVGDSSTLSSTAQSIVDTCRFGTSADSCADLKNDPFHLFGFINTDDSEAFRCVLITLRRRPRHEDDMSMDTLFIRLLMQDEKIDDDTGGGGTGSGTSRPE